MRKNRKRLLRVGAVVWLAAIVALGVAPHATGESGLRAYTAKSRAAPLYMTADLPGFLIISPLVEAGLGYSVAEGTVAQTHALASPVYPGGVVVGLPSVLALLGLPSLPVGYPFYGESFSPPGGTSTGAVPNLGDPAIAGFAGANSTATAGDMSASADADLGDLSVLGGLIRISAATSETSFKADGDIVRSTATSAVGRLTIDGLITIEGITADADFTTDGAPTASSTFGRCRILDVACEITPDGISLGGSQTSLPVASAAASALDGLAEQGISVRLGTTVTTESAIETSVLEITAQVPIEPPNAGVPPQTALAVIKVGWATASARATPGLPVGAPLSGSGQPGPVGPADDAAGAPQRVTAIPSIPSIGPSDSPPPPAANVSGPAEILQLIARVARLGSGSILFLAITAGLAVLIGARAFVPRTEVARLVGG